MCSLKFGGSSFVLSSFAPLHCISWCCRKRSSPPLRPGGNILIFCGPVLYMNLKDDIFHHFSTNFTPPRQIWSKKSNKKALVWWQISFITFTFMFLTFQKLKIYLFQNYWHFWSHKSLQNFSSKLIYSLYFCCKWEDFSFSLTK